jgi:hypothetical protein
MHKSHRLCFRLACALVLSTVAAYAGDILTAQYDTARTSWNSSEIYLSTATVKAGTFGKLYSRTLDGWVYAQPLYAEKVSIPGHGTPNVVIVCTAANTVYAFDADSAATPFWSKNLGPADTTPDGPNSPNSEPSLGIISTPVIVRSLSTIYVTAATREKGHRVYRLHALDLATGREQAHSPVVIAGKVKGTAPEAVKGVLTFDPDYHLQRASLAVAGHSVYLETAGSHDTTPFHGWVFGYDLTTLEQTGIFNLTSAGEQGGVWQSTRAPAVDADGNIYMETGNGDYDGVSNFSNSVVKMRATETGLGVADWFTPDNWVYLTDNDLDLASAGPLLVPGTPYLIAAGKTGTIYVVDTGKMGKEQTGNPGLVQQLQATPLCTDPNSCDIANDLIFWSNGAKPLLFVWPWGDVLRAYNWLGKGLSPVEASNNNLPSGYPGGYLAGSSYEGTAGTGIVWALTGDNQSTEQGTLHAYDALNVGHEIWNSALNVRDAVGAFAQNTPPLVVNGKVYVASFSNEFSVYGLLNGPVPGDVNADGKTDCADYSLVRAALGTKAGQAGFDARADVVADGVINVLDLALVAKNLAVGKVCP